MTTGNQFGIKEVFNLVIADPTKKVGDKDDMPKPLYYIDYAETTTNEVSAERIDVRGGHGHFKLLTFDHSKESQLTVNLPLVDIGFLAMIGGSELVQGSADLFHREVVTVEEEETEEVIKLSKEPRKDGDDYSLYLTKLDNTRDFGEEITDFTVDGKNVTINNDVNVEKGDQIVAFYMYEASSTKKVTISSRNFPKTVTMYGEGLWTDQSNNVVLPVKAVIHRARPQSEFSLTMSGTEATELELTFDMYGYKDADGNYTYVDYYVLEEEE